MSWAKATNKFLDLLSKKPIRTLVALALVGLVSYVVYRYEKVDDQIKSASKPQDVRQHSDQSTKSIKQEGPQTINSTGDKNQNAGNNTGVMVQTNR